MHLSKHLTAVLDCEILKDRGWALGTSPSSAELPTEGYPVKKQERGMSG